MMDGRMRVAQAMMQRPQMAAPGMDGAAMPQPANAKPTAPQGMYSLQQPPMQPMMQEPQQAAMGFGRIPQRFR